MQESTKELLVIVSSIVVVGAFIYWKFRKEISLRFAPKKAEGKIINWMAAQEGGKRFYYPIIEFYDAHGKRFSYRATERCEGEPMFPQGTAVWVHYLEKDPAQTKTIYPKK